jgi:hypothetical protein
VQAAAAKHQQQVNELQEELRQQESYVQVSSRPLSLD